MVDNDDTYIKPEQKARRRNDAMLEAAGWAVQDDKAINVYAGEGVPVRDLVNEASPADYVLFVNRRAVGVIEANKKGTTLYGVEWQTVKYQTNSPDALASVLIDRRLPFGCESTGTRRDSRAGWIPTRRRCGHSGSAAPRHSNGYDAKAREGGGACLNRNHNLDPPGRMSVTHRTARATEVDGVPHL